MKAPQSLIYYLVFWLLVYIFNNTMTFIDLDQSIQGIMEQIQAQNIDFSENDAKNVFYGVTLLSSLISFLFAFLLYKGVKFVRLLNLALCFIGLPFTLFGLLSFAKMSNIERIQSLLGIFLNVVTIYVLLRKDVKDYFYFVPSAASNEPTEEESENVAESPS